MIRTDIGTLFGALIVLVLAWAAWTYLPAPVGVVVGAVLFLIAVYLILVAIGVDFNDGNTTEAVLPILGLTRLRHLKL